MISCELSYCRLSGCRLFNRCGYTAGNNWNTYRSTVWRARTDSVHVRLSISHRVRIHQHLQLQIRTSITSFLDFESLLSCLCCSWVVVHKPLIELNSTEFYDWFFLCDSFFAWLWISQGPCCKNKMKMMMFFITVSLQQTHYVNTIG